MQSVNQPPQRTVCARSPPFRKVPEITAPLRLCWLRAASSIGVNTRTPSIRNTVSIHSNLAFRGLVVPVVFPCESFVTKPGLSDGGLLSCDQGVQLFSGSFTHSSAYARTESLTYLSYRVNYG
jgi:hypothetical protein